MMTAVRGSFPHIFLEKPNQIIDEKINQIRQISFEQILAGPTALDRFTMISVPQHFAFGCEYTIAAWVWIWKTSSRYDDYPMTLFSTRTIDPSLEQSHQLLPAVIFNLYGNSRDKFFFAGEKGLKDDHIGLWSNTSIRYHEWIHVAITVKENTQLEGWINGESSGKVSFPRNDHTAVKCDYQRYFSTGEVSSFVNNTIFQVGGNKEGITFPGMVQDVYIVKNLAMNQTEIEELMRLRPPKSFPTLSKLLPKYGKYRQV
jgi:hypothetical protein